MFVSFYIFDVGLVQWGSAVFRQLSSEIIDCLSSSYSLRPRKYGVFSWSESPRVSD